MAHSLRVIDEKAKLSVARGCGFACLAILCMMVGMSVDIARAFQGGGVTMLLMAIVLILKRLHLERISHKRTELWIMLAPAERPPDDIARAVITAILGRTYLEFALKAAQASIFMFVISLGLAFTKGH